MSRRPPPQAGAGAGRALDVAAAVVTVLLLLVVGLGLTGVLRGLLALVFVTFVPGWAVLDHLDLAEGASKLALATALSLTICTLAALGALWLGMWHPLAAFDILAGLSLLGVTASLTRSGPGTDAPVVRSPR